MWTIAYLCTLTGANYRTTPIGVCKITVYNNRCVQHANYVQLVVFTIGQIAHAHSCVQHAISVHTLAGLYNRWIEYTKGLQQTYSVHVRQQVWTNRWVSYSSWCENQANCVHRKQQVSFIHQLVFTQWFAYTSKIVFTTKNILKNGEFCAHVGCSHKEYIVQQEDCVFFKCKNLYTTSCSRHVRHV